MSTDAIPLFDLINATAELTCNWCGIPHPVTHEFRDRFLKAMEEQLKRMPIYQLDDLDPEECWCCPSCLCWLTGISPSNLVAQVCDHDIPTQAVEREVMWTGGVVK